ncbi:MAG: HAD-IC family P-type ATPase [Gammaproteobacteria bacterium]|nr:HAD-IC family P-type ATPase [Pseudomonadales bacterium]MCP5348521.1 HAD-IC family P-type ATPase [Pseudomonadales bacterium]
MNETPVWHALSPEQSLESLSSSQHGLSAGDAADRLARFGPNVIPEPPPRTLLAVYLSQFRNAFIYLLLLATGVSLALGEFSDALFIAVALQLNALIGTAQEWQAQERALGLKSLVHSMLTVVRDGSRIQLDGRELVPGDIVELESGVRIPAAMRLLTTKGLEVDESLLTGESVPVSKDAGQVLNAQVSLADRVNMLHAGTTILHGRATALVTATGLSTEVGQVAESLKLIDEVKPPLIGRMETFTHIVAILMVGVIALIALVEFLRDTDPATILLTSVALAVAAIPEGLPVALTVALAISVSRMARRDVVVRKLAAVEGLGACTLIASDKTGTLTVNELTVQRVFLPGFGDLEVAGILTQCSDPSRGYDAELPAAFKDLVAAGLLCNEARLETGPDGTLQLFGDTVDGAFLKLGRLAGLERTELDSKLPRVDRIPYEPSLAFAASFHHRDDALHAWVKGAAEVILPFCRAGLDSTIPEQVNQLAGAGYRVIALAAGPVAGSGQEHLRDLEFLGLVALIDPLRPAAVATVQRCRDAGVAFRMITGDHPLTALEIGRQLSIADSADDVVTGEHLSSLQSDQTAFDAVVARTRIFARIAPLQKLSIVQSMQRVGNTVAVTGDGVNDAAALAAADIGAAMGKSGTDIARSASDLILVKDELASLVDGIEEGRIAYDNIRKVIYLLISTGAAELVLFLAAIVTGLPIPLSAVQLIWLNLVSEGIQDVALAFEKGEPGVLARRPRPSGEGIFNRQMIEQTVLSGLVIGGVAFAFYTYLVGSGVEPFAASNQLLLLLVFFENVQVFNCRSELRSAFSIPIRNNPFLILGVVGVQLLHIAAMNLPGLSHVLDIEPVSLKSWIGSALMALSVIAVMECYKVFRRAGQAAGTRH